MTRPRDVALYGGGVLFQQAITFISGVVVARWLGPGGYGVLSLTRNVFNLLLILGPLGLDISLLRHLADSQEHPDKMIRHLAAARLIALTFNLTGVLLVGLIGGPWLELHIYKDPHFSTYLLLTVCALPFAADMAILTAAFRAYGRPTLQIIVSLFIQPLLRLVLLLVALWLGYAIPGVLMATVAGYMGGNLLLAIMLGNRGGGAAEKGKRHLTLSDFVALKELMKFSAWVMMSLLVYGALRNVDVLILGRFTTTKIVGEYAAMSTLAQLIQIAPSALSQTLGPSIARFHLAADVSGLKETLNGYLRRASLLAAPIYGAVAVFGPALSLAFGKKFQFDPLVAFNLSTGYLLSAVLSGLGFSLSMTGRHRIEFAFLALGFLGALSGCYILGPVLGAQGVALAIALSYVVINVGRMLVVSRTYNFVPGSWRDCAPPVVSVGIAMGAKCLAQGVFADGPVGLLVGVLSYFMILGAVYWFGILVPSESAYLKDRVLGLGLAFGGILHGRSEGR